MLSVRVGLVVLVLAVAGVSGCGGEDESGSSAGAASGSDTVYKIGYTGPLSGAISYLGAPNAAALRAYFDKVNREGGINGATVEMEELDDKGQPDLAIANFKQLAQDSLMIAGISLSTTSEAIGPTAEREQIPFIGVGIANSQINPVSKYAFMTGSTGRHHVDVAKEFILDDAEKRGIEKPKVAVLVVDTVTSKDIADMVDQEAQAGVWEVTSQEFIPLTASDASAQVRKIASSDPEYVITWLSVGTLPMVGKAMKAAGLAGDDVKVFGGFSVVAEDVIQQSGLTNYYVDYIHPWAAADADIPALEDVQAAAAESGVEDQLTQQYFMDGWITGMLITEALRNCGEDCTPATMTETMATTSIGDAGGLSGGEVGFSSSSHAAFGYHQVGHYDPDQKMTELVFDDWRCIIPEKCG